MIHIYTIKHLTERILVGIHEISGGGKSCVYHENAEETRGRRDCSSDKGYTVKECMEGDIFIYRQLEANLLNLLETR